MSPACAQTTIIVNDPAQGPTVNNPTGQGDLTCTLGDAILTANSLASSGGPVGGCSLRGVGAPYTIVLLTTTFTLTSVHNYWYGPNALPPIATQIVIQGDGATLNIPASDNNGNPITRLRFFYVGADPSAPATLNFVTPGAGHLTLQNLTLTGGRQLGGMGGIFASGGAGMGGAIFNQGTLNLVDTTLSGNTATGGGRDPNQDLPGGGMGQDGGCPGVQLSSCGGGFGGTLTSSIGGPFSNLSRGGVGLLTGEYTNGGGAGFAVTDNGNSNGNGGGVPDGLGGRGQSSAISGHGSGAGTTNGNCENVGDGGDFGAGGDGCGGGGVGGGGGLVANPDFSPAGGGSGGFGGGGSVGFYYGGNDGFGAAEGLGGAIFNHAGSLTVLNSTLTGNTATGGGTNFGGSQGSGLGGAICNLNGNVTVSFSTLDGNFLAVGAVGEHLPILTTAGAVAAGGAIYSLGYNLQPGQTASVSISNSILADTVGGSDLTIDQPSHVSGSSGGGLNVATSSVTFQGVNIVPNATYPGTPTVNGPAPVLASPQVGTLQLNAPGLTPTMAITTASPAFHGTACDPAVTTDQRGVARPQPTANACDIGAYELQLQTITFTGLPSAATFGSAGPYLLNGTASSGLAVSYSVSGPATLSGNTLTITGPGTVIVTASQAGNSNYSAATPVSQTIQVSAATITVQYASEQLVYPGATNVTVCIAPAHSITATGSVEIFDGKTLLATVAVQGGGCAYWYISPGLAAGNHVLTAVYSGDKNNPAGTSAPTNISVAPVAVKLAPACWLTNTGYGANYQCTVSLSSNAGSAQGVMTYSYDGGSPVSVPVANGTANFTLNRPAAGSHSVVIAYAQQTNYAAAGPVTENFTVPPAMVNVQLTPSSWYTSASAGITFTATVNSSSAGAPSSNGSVAFFDGSTLLATVPVNSNGQASYSTTKLAPGSHTITATYSGGVNYASGSSSVSITLTK